MDDRTLDSLDRIFTPYDKRHAMPADNWVDIKNLDGAQWQRVFALGAYPPAGAVIERYGILEADGPMIGHNKRYQNTYIALENGLCVLTKETQFAPHLMFSARYSGHELYTVSDLMEYIDLLNAVEKKAILYKGGYRKQKQSKKYPAKWILNKGNITYGGRTAHYLVWVDKVTGDPLEVDADGDNSEWKHEKKACSEAVQAFKLWDEVEELYKSKEPTVTV